MSQLKQGNNEKNTINAVETTFMIVDELHAHGQMGVSELAERTELSRSTIHKHLTTLVKFDYATKIGHEYQLGVRFLDIGGELRENIVGSRLIKKKILEVAAESEERTQFLILENGRVVVLYREGGSHAVSTQARIGLRHFPNQVAAGKAMLSVLKPDEVNKILNHMGLPSATKNTITVRDQLFKELETVRDQGYAFSYGESQEDLWAVSVPLYCPDLDLLGAIAVAGPKQRMQGTIIEEELPRLLLMASNELKLNIENY